PGHDVGNADAVRVLVHGDGLRAVTVREREGHAAGGGDVALVDRTVRPAARRPVAVEVVDDRRLPGLRAVARAPRLGDVRAAEAAGPGLVAEDLEEAPALDADLVPRDLTGRSDEGLGQAEEATRHALVRERAVHADVAAGCRDFEVFEAYLA